MPTAFISHASEDKDDFVRPLALALRRQHVPVWYDEFELRVGDGLRATIDRGLSKADLSENFFSKPWPERELEGLIAKEMSGDRRVVLPIWHNVDFKRVLEYSPPLANVFALKSSSGLDEVVESLMKVIRPNPSPLVVARDELLKHWDKVPEVTEEWWLDVLEFKERDLRFPEPGMATWIFPLPCPNEATSAERGRNLASAALQMDWSYDAEDLQLSQLTHPGRIQEFVHSWSGLYETSQANADVLALYAPQLTLPGYDEGFSRVFDDLLLEGPGRFHEVTHTIDGCKPLCEKVIAWRHPSFGNYKPRKLAQSFASEHSYRYARKTLDGMDCVVWLLSDHSGWMPSALRECLISGFRERDLWLGRCDMLLRTNAFVSRLYGTRSRFRATRSVKAGLIEIVAKALNNIRFEGNASAIADRFLERDFIGGHYDWEDEIRESRSRR